MKEYYSINEKELYNNNYNIDIIENFQIFKGPDGPKGERGYEGIRGLQGLQGLQRSSSAQHASIQGSV